jgi:putative peptide zinc metalloprotease protein
MGGRVRYRRPATVELAVLDPRRALNRLRPVADATATRTGQAAVWVVTLAGLLTAVAEARRVHADLSRPARWWVAIGALGVVLLTTALHEVAHGLALSHAGGRVRRMGFMLLYGSPALFCDVSDAWRLPRRQRATVAFAGARLHGAVAGALMLGAAAAPDGDGRQLLVVAGIGSAVMAVVNLYPFVKFDGYIALVGWLDHPHLRRHTVSAARDLLLTRGVFGAPRRAGPTAAGAARPLAGGWILFGVVSAVSAPVLIGLAFRWNGPLLLMVLGPVGAVVTLALLALCMAYPTTSLVHAARQAALTGAPRWRRVVGGVLFSVALGGLLATPRVPLSVLTVYQRIGAETVVVVPEGGPLHLGAHVTLRRAGVVLHPVLGHGVVCGPARPVMMNRSAGSPVLGPSGTPTGTARRQAVPVCAAGDGHDLAASGATGLASVGLGHVAVGTWLHRTFVEPALARLR